MKRRRRKLRPRTFKEIQEERADYEPGGEYWGFASGEYRSGTLASQMDLVLRQVARANQRIHCDGMKFTIDDLDVEAAVRGLIDAVAHLARIVEKLLPAEVAETELSGHR